MTARSSDDDEGPPRSSPQGTEMDVRNGRRTGNTGHSRSLPVANGRPIASHSPLTWADRRSVPTPPGLDAGRSIPHCLAHSRHGRSEPHERADTAQQIGRRALSTIEIVGRYSGTGRQPWRAFTASAGEQPVPAVNRLSKISPVRQVREVPRRSPIGRHRSTSNSLIVLAASW